MTTLTITAAKKNLGKWLNAAIKGEDVGIVSGHKVVALRPVEVEATDYLWREYGITPQEMDRFIDKENKRIDKMMRDGNYIVLPDNLEDALEAIAHHRPRRTKAASRASRKRVR